MPVPCLKRSSPVQAGALAISALALTACDGEPPAAPPRPSGVRIQLAELTRTSDVVTLTGAVQARVQSDLSFRFTGRMAARFAEVGDHVVAGQVLAKLETSQQEADVASAKAGVAAAEATLRQTTASFARQKTLIDKGFTTRTLYDNANQALLAAKADLEARQSDLGLALDRLSNAELRADAAGVITARHAEAGQVVDVAQQIFTLAHDGPRDAVFEVFESLVARPPEGGAVVRVALLSNKEVTATGRVREIAPAVNATTGTVRVKVAIEDTPSAMGLGAAVSGSGDFRPRDVVRVPASAFVARGGQPAVWVVDPKTNVASENLVEVDGYQTGALLIASGVNQGDLVVTEGGQFVKPGDVVEPITASKSAELPK